MEEIRKRRRPALITLLLLCDGENACGSFWLSVCLSVQSISIKKARGPYLRRCGSVCTAFAWGPYVSLHVVVKVADFSLRHIK